MRNGARITEPQTFENFGKPSQFGKDMAQKRKMGRKVKSKLGRRTLPNETSIEANNTRGRVF